MDERQLLQFLQSCKELATIERFSWCAGHIAKELECFLEKSSHKRINLLKCLSWFKDWDLNYKDVTMRASHIKLIESLSEVWGQFVHLYAAIPSTEKLKKSERILGLLYEVVEGCRWDKLTRQAFLSALDSAAVCGFPFTYHALEVAYHLGATPNELLRILDNMDFNSKAELLSNLLRLSENWVLVEGAHFSFNGTTTLKWLALDELLALDSDAIELNTWATIAESLFSFLKGRIFRWDFITNFQIIVALLKIIRKHGSPTAERGQDPIEKRLTLQGILRESLVRFFGQQEDAGWNVTRIPYELAMAVIDELIALLHVEGLLYKQDIIQTLLAMHVLEEPVFEEVDWWRGQLYYKRGIIWASIETLLRRWILLMETGRRLKNRIYDLADRHDLQTGQLNDLFGVGSYHFLEIGLAELPRSDADLLRQYLELLAELDWRIEQTKRWLVEAARTLERVRCPAYQWLQSIPGIGNFLALVILTEIGRIGIEHFPSPKKLASYAGLVPWHGRSIKHSLRFWRSSNSLLAARHGQITDLRIRMRRSLQTNVPSIHAGNGWLRWALMEAAWPAICTSSWLRAFYERVKQQKGANKAKVAVARKLCELVWYVWKEQRPYEERTAPGCPGSSLAR